MNTTNLLHSDKIGLDDVRVKQPIHMTYKKKINAKKDLLMSSLTEFYTAAGKIAQILPIIRGDSKVSLRIIDWFVTNYSKKNNIGYRLDDGKQFIVYLNYKSQLRAYSKKQFDPFCRRERISYYYNEAEEKMINQDHIKKRTPKKESLFQDESPPQNVNETEHPDGTLELITTVGQLNFFRWAIDNKVLEFIHNHIAEIEEDMNVSIRPIYNNRNRKKGDTTRRKRHELSISATKSISKHDVKVVVAFD